MSEHFAGVTGEAVVLELRLAKLASRSLALGIDLAVQLSVFLVGTFVVAGAVSFVDDALATALALVFYVAVIVGYPVAMETATRGRTLGKMALGLRVVREDGGPIRFRHAFVRGLLSVVEIWLTFGSVALITSLASPQGKRLGDLLAGTVVVRERIPVRGTPMAAMPPPLAAWAGGLDLSQVPDDLALAARQFLARADELAPEVRDRMGARIASSLAAVTAPPPPPGTPPWAFLSAVLAERRRRELERLGANATAPGPAPRPAPAPASAPGQWGPPPPAAPSNPAAPAPPAPQDSPFAPPG
ncbi:MAG TPA: RDD family protein [Actinomycetes bacterium]|nr:RDD family protein [Actinomycetes bacterium]